MDLLEKVDTLGESAQYDQCGVRGNHASGERDDFERWIYPAVRPGGTVLLTAACPEGMGDDEFRQGILTGSDDELVASLLADYRVYGQTALAWRRKLADCRLILVSRLPPSLVREIGAEPAVSLKEAMQLAAARLQGPVKGWLFRQGSRWLVEPVNHCALTV